MTARKSAEDRKAEIVSAALHLADQVGPDRLTTEMIAKAVGISQPGVFRHFPRKENIWEAVAARLGDDMAQAWESASRAHDVPVERLRAIAMAQLNLIAKTPALPAILFSRELHQENDSLRAAIFKTMNRFHRLIGQTIDEAVRVEIFNADLDSSDAAFLVIGLIQSLALRWSLSGRRFDFLETGERLLVLQLAGFKAVPPPPPRRRSPN